MNSREALKNVAIVACISALLATAIFGWGYHRGRKAAISAMKPETDTLVIFDTVVHDRPVHDTIWRYTDRYVIVPVTDTVMIVRHDTTYIQLPREAKEYRDSSYYCRVSGYDPELERIEVFNRQVIVTERVTVPGPPRRWGIGLQSGYGLTYAGEFIARPYIGVGISYNIITFGKK